MAIDMNTSVELMLRTLYDNWIFIEVTVPEELFPQVQEAYPKFDCHGKVKLMSTDTGYRLSSVGDVYNAHRRYEYFNRKGEPKELSWEIPQVELPEFLWGIVSKEEVRIQKNRLKRMRLRKLTEQDEASFNSKNWT